MDISCTWTDHNEYSSSHGLPVSIAIVAVALVDHLTPVDDWLNPECLSHLRGLRSLPLFVLVVVAVAAAAAVAGDDTSFASISSHSLMILMTQFCDDNNAGVGDSLLLCDGDD